MFSPQAILVIFESLDYSDSEVIKELHFSFGLSSLTMKGQPAIKSSPPTPRECYKGHLSPELRALREIQCKHIPLSPPRLWPRQLSSQHLPNSVPISPQKEPCSPPFLLSVFLYLFLNLTPSGQTHF